MPMGTLATSRRPSAKRTLEIALPCPCQKFINGELRALGIGSGRPIGRNDAAVRGKECHVGLESCRQFLQCRLLFCERARCGRQDILHQAFRP